MANINGQPRKPNLSPDDVKLLREHSADSVDYISKHLCEAFGNPDELVKNLVEHLLQIEGTETLNDILGGCK